MTILMLDGFDHYGTIAVANEWKYFLNSGSFDTSIKRTGSHSLATSGTSEVGYFNLDSVLDEIIVGCASHFTDEDVYDDINGVGFLCLKDNVGGDQLTLTFGSANNIKVRRGSHTGTVIHTTGNNAIYAGSFFYVEFWAKIHNTTGFVKIRVNNELIVDISGIDTQNTANQEIGRVQLTRRTAGFFTTNEKLDDLYIVDPLVSPNDDFLGDIRCYTQYPDAPGASSDFDDVGASPNFECVNDPVPDDDSTYVQSSTTNHRDLYGMQALPLGATGLVRGVQLVTRAKKTDAGDAKFKQAYRSPNSPNTVALGAEKVLSTDYRYYHHVLEADPVTSSAITLTELAAAQIGYDVTA